MKAIQAIVLVLVGVVGTIVFVKLNSGPEPAPPVAQAPENTVAPVSTVEPVPAEPTRTEKKKPARVAATPSHKDPTHKDREPPMMASNSQPIQPPQQEAPPPMVTTPAPPVEPAPRAVEPPPPPPPPRKVTLDVGTVLAVRLIENLSSDRNHPGDTFTASLDEPIVVDGMVIAEKNARVEGRIVDTTQAGRVKGLAAINLELTTLVTSDGQRVPIATESFKKDGPESKKKDAAKVGGGAALGAIIGAIAGGGKGAAIGAGAGGAAGTGDVLLTRGDAAVLKSETKLTFHLSNSVTITEKRRRG
jgi:hypothetical protein